MKILIRMLLAVFPGCLCQAFHPYFARIGPEELAEIKALEARLSTPWQEISLVACLIIREETRESGFGWGDG